MSFSEKINQQLALVAFTSCAVRALERDDRDPEATEEDEERDPTKTEGEEVNGVPSILPNSDRDPPSLPSAISTSAKTMNMSIPSTSAIRIEFGLSAVPDE